MASETASQVAPPPEPKPPVSRSRQWFSLWAATAGWLLLGFASMIITWQACLHHEQLGGASSHTGLLVLNMIVFFGLLATSIWAGILAYRAWRHRAGAGSFIAAEAEDRHEYMAMIGVLMTVIMGIGLIWMALPLWMISLCVRTR